MTTKKLTREERIAAGWTECWGAYDYGNGKWIRRGMSRQSAELRAHYAGAMRGLNKLKARRFWRRKKPKAVVTISLDDMCPAEWTGDCRCSLPRGHSGGHVARQGHQPDGKVLARWPNKPEPAFEVGQWVVLRGATKELPFKITFIDGDMAGAENVYKRGIIERYVGRLANLEPMPINAVPLLVGDIVEDANGTSTPKGTRGQVTEVTDDSFPIGVAWTTGRGNCMRTCELRLIHRDEPKEPKPAAPAEQVPAFKPGDRVRVEFDGRIDKVDISLRALAYRVEILPESFQSGEGGCIWLNEARLRRLP